MKRSKKLSFVLIALVIGVMAAALALTGCGGTKITFMNGDAVHQVVKGEPGSDIGALKIPEKTGYEFEKWIDKDGADFTDTVFPASDTTVYAKFTPNNYKVKFDPNGGKGTAVTVDATYDVKVTVPASVGDFVKADSEFAGWVLDKKAEAADFSASEDIKNVTAEKDATVTLYAYWIPLGSATNFTVENDTVTGYNGNSTVIRLPDTATKIADEAFRDNTTLKEVIIPETYTEIGFGAFAGCTNLEKITIPFIGGSKEDNRFLAYIFGAINYTDNTFSYQLTDVDGADRVIDENTLQGSFYIPKSLRIVVINSDVDEIPEGAFYYAFGLEKVIAYRFTDTPGEKDAVYTYRIKTVGDSAFECCHRIGYDTKAKVSYKMGWLSGVETFGNKAFKNYITANNDGEGFFASELADLGTLDEVVSVGEEAFANNMMLAEVKFGEKLERIEKSAFASCNLMQRVVIPDSCTYIGDGAFEACIYLASVTIGRNVEYVGKFAFATSLAMTEVFFKNDTLPATLEKNAFYGARRRGESGLEAINDNCNEGLVFYFENEAAATNNAATLKAHYTNSSTSVKHEKRGPYYYMGNGYDYTLTFTEGHSVALEDPYLRVGFGIPVVMGTYEQKTADDGVWYDAEVYEVAFLTQERFKIKLDYYLSAKYTHYYIYKVDTFTLDQITGQSQSFIAGNKSRDEWVLEENEYGQIGLFHYGELVPIDTEKGATYVVGGVSQTYEDRTLRTFVYRQGNEYFEEVLAYNFVYIPDPTMEDKELIYYGTLHKVDDTLNMLFGNYQTTDRMYNSRDVFVDEVTKEIRITDAVGRAVASGTYTTESTFGSYTDKGVDAEGIPVREYNDYTLTFTATAGSNSGKEYTVTFTNYLDSVREGNNLRNIYARCIFTEGEGDDAKTFILYNTKYSNYSNVYGIRSSGTLFDNDRYVLMQYNQLITGGEGEAAFEYDAYPGFGEHVYTVGSEQYTEYLTYDYTEDESGAKYDFTVEANRGTATEERKYTGRVTDTFTGAFSAEVGTGGTTRNYVGYYSDEANREFSDGTYTIKLTGYGRATLTDKGGTVTQGSYNVYSDTTVAQVYLTSRQYVNHLEYIFKPDNGDDPMFFVPIFYDSYDGKMHEGDMLRPDITRNRTYRLFDRRSGYCTAIFASSGYGMGIFYVMVDPKTNSAVGIDNYFFAPGVLMADYEQVGEKYGQPLYRVYNYLDQGFFVFTPTERLNYGTIADTSRQLAYVMEVDEEYDNWYNEPAALLLTGDLSPGVESMEIMPAREEMGVYVAPNGYRLELDGKGTAKLSDASGTPIHTASYKSIDENVLGKKVYPFEYTAGGTTYKGEIHVNYDREKKIDSAMVCLEGFEVNGVKLSHFAKGPVKNYTGDSGTFTIYEDNERVGFYDPADGGSYSLGKYEKADGEENKYTFRFPERKVVLTLDESAGTYTLTGSYKAVRLPDGDYSGNALSAAYSKDDKGNKVKNELKNSQGEIIETDVLEWYGFEVLALKGRNTPYVNRNSEYMNTSVRVEEGKKDIYFYYGKAYDATVVAYEDGEVIVTYNHLDIIEIVNTGWFHSKDEEDNAYGENFIIMDKGNGIVVYVDIGMGVG